MGKWENSEPPSPFWRNVGNSGSLHLYKKGGVLTMVGELFYLNEIGINLQKPKPKPICTYPHVMEDVENIVTLDLICNLKFISSEVVPCLCKSTIQTCKGKKYSSILLRS